LKTRFSTEWFTTVCDRSVTLLNEAVLGLPVKGREPGLEVPLRFGSPITPFILRDRLMKGRPSVWPLRSVDRASCKVYQGMLHLRHCLSMVTRRKGRKHLVGEIAQCSCSGLSGLPALPWVASRPRRARGVNYDTHDRSRCSIGQWSRHRL
jgi:hypothetical protein